MSEEQPKLGVWGLSAMVFGMVVGAGIFNLPQNLASGASAGGVALAWIVMAIGMMLLLTVFGMLTRRQPAPQAGIYEYARQGFGPFAGFNIAWGYWLCTAFSNVAYIVMLAQALEPFMPGLGEGWPLMLFGTGVIWLMYFLVSSGLKTAKVLTTLLAAVKFLAIALIIILLGVNIRLGLFTSSFWSSMGSISGLAGELRSSMLVTLWCFIGIEGAVIMGTRARRTNDVMRAGLGGFLAAWVLYVLVSLLCFGVMARAEMAGLGNPSVAYVLGEACGPWAMYFVSAAVIVALIGGLVPWSIVCAEVPYTASMQGMLPKRLGRLNRHGMPGFGLMVCSVVMTGFLGLLLCSGDIYMRALEVIGMMILPAYLFSALYLVKIGRGRERAAGVACTLFCLWMIYAGGIGLLLDTAWFYLLGLPFYLLTRSEQGQRWFTPRGRIALVLIMMAALATLFV